MKNTGEHANLLRTVSSRCDRTWNFGHSEEVIRAPVHRWTDVRPRVTATTCQKVSVSCSTGARADARKGQVVNTATHVPDANPRIPCINSVAQEKTTANSKTTVEGLATPINTTALKYLLQGYPKSDLIVNRFTEGAYLNYEGEEFEFIAKNPLSILEYEHEIEEKISHEIELGRIDGPHDFPPFQNFRCSPLGAREKSDSTIDKRAMSLYHIEELP